MGRKQTLQYVRNRPGADTLGAQLNCESCYILNESSMTPITMQVRVPLSMLRVLLDRTCYSKLAIVKSYHTGTSCNCGVKRGRAT
jgi:hypothetical protein